MMLAALVYINTHYVQYASNGFFSCGNRLVPHGGLINFFISISMGFVVFKTAGIILFLCALGRVCYPCLYVRILFIAVLVFVGYFPL